MTDWRQSYKCSEMEQNVNAGLRMFVMMDIIVIVM